MRQSETKSVITLSPMRISFVGGGTDLPNYYKKHGGLAVGAAINTYNTIHFISHAKTVEPWSLYSTRGSQPAADIGGKAIVDAVLHEYGLTNTCSAFSYSDLVMLGSGLGSSSALSVGAVNAANVHLDADADKSMIAEEAYRIERHIVGSPVGKQDHYMSAFGGLQIYEFESNGQVRVTPVSLNKTAVCAFQEWLTLVRVPRTLSANAILANHAHQLTGHCAAISREGGCRHVAAKHMDHSTPRHRCGVTRGLKPRPRE